MLTYRMYLIRKVAFADFKNRKVIMVRSKKNRDVYYTLGGKIEEGESDIECLLREVKEEVNSTFNPKTAKFLHEFQTAAHGKDGAILNIRLYSGELTIEPKPSSEIADVDYFDSNADEKHTTIMGRMILRWLHINNYID